MHDVTDQLRLMLTEISAFNRKDQYVQFDPLWYHPHQLSLTSELIHTYLLHELGELIPEDRTRLVLLSPDNVKPDFGIIPVMVTVANRIGCRMAIWKEFASMKWGTSSIIGPEIRDLNCVVLQHVVRHGTTAVRVAHAVKDIHWNFLAYVTVVLNPVDGEEVIARSLDKVEKVFGTRPFFRYMISTEEL